MYKTKVNVGIISFFIFLSLFIIIFNSELVMASGKDIYVDDDQKYPDDADGSLYNPFRYVQDAIDAAQDGDTIKILPGIYPGDFVVYRSVTITTEDMINTYISSRTQNPYVIEITAPSVSLEMLSIRDFTNTSHRKAVIHTSSEANNVKIINNYINQSDHGYGIDIDGAESVIIKNNTINGTRGINIQNSNLITIDSNHVGNCTDFPALKLASSNGNYIGDNIFENSTYGIYSDDCDDNSIYNNTVIENINIGIIMSRGNNNILIDNIITSNGNTGIDLKSSNGIVSGNTITKNNIGLSIRKSGNIIRNNTLNEGGVYDIYARPGSSNNLIYNNTFLNKIGIHALEEGNNQWDNDAVGNYWSDFYGPDPENENNTVQYNSVNVPDVYKYRSGRLTDNYPKGRYHKQPEIEIDTTDFTTPSPYHLDDGVSRSPRLSVVVKDPDPSPYTERLDVSFYYMLEGVSNLIDIDDNVESGGTASVWFSSTIAGKNAVYSYAGLGYDYICEWYVEVEDSYSKVKSPVWIFTTMNTPVDNIKPNALINAPETYIVGEEINAQVNDILHFDASDSNDIDGEIIFYRWSFGNEANVVNEIFTAHSFKQEGEHIINLVVIDNNGSSNTSDIKCVIGSSANRAPKAVITAPSSGFVGDSILFSSSGSSDPDIGDSISRYSWVFGDGSISYDENPIYSYSKAGKYTVTLTVTDQNSVTGINSIDILIKTKQSDESPGFEIILLLCTIAFILLLKRKSKSY